MAKLINDHDTDTVFFSKWIENFKCHSAITNILDKHQFKHGLLPFTNDYWARDYMPIQITEHRYIHYCYNPDYLQKQKSYITDATPCCVAFGIDPIRTEIVMDGGNAIKCNDYIVMTDKVLVENSSYSKTRLIDELENLFQGEIIFITWDKREPYGHADGMVRYVDENTILLNNYIDFDKSLRKKIIGALSHKFNIVELHYQVPNRSSLSWAYINFLHVGNLIILPSMGIEEDTLAYSQFDKLFKNHIIEQVEASEIVKLGGALNCISWNIKQSLKLKTI